MPENKPNILFVISDQLKASALKAYGHPLVNTPNLDRLAERGVVFENCYSTSPLCAPARATIMNGLLPSRTGVYDNAAEFPSATSFARKPTKVWIVTSGLFRSCETV